MKETSRALCGTLALLIAVLLGGCGEDADFGKFRVAESDDSSRAPAVPKVAQDEKQDKKAEEEQGPPPVAVDPHNLFVIADDQSNFEIVEDGNTFLAEVPADGLDSRYFTARFPPETLEPPGEPNRDLKLPDGFTVVEKAGYSQEGWPWRIRCDKDGALMALVPASIGIQGSDDGPPEARPQFAVFLDPFYIDTTEVTLRQYKEFRQEWRETENRTLPSPANASSPQNHPALGISWGNARRYARWAGKQLPTEAEWERAARGPDGFPHPWGSGPPAWFPPRARDQIDPVASFQADLSPYGVYDLAGNAREWCQDWYSATAYRRAAESGETVLRNWQGPSRSSSSFPNHRVVKGNGPGWMAWHRAPGHMRNSAPDIGFRCVLRGNVPDESTAAR